MKKQALITGGSRGIGYELIKLLSDEYDFVNISRNPCDIPGVVNIQADLSKQCDFLELLYTPFDLVIFNAAALSSKFDVVDVTHADLIESFNVVLFNHLRLFNVVQGNLRGESKIVAISSRAGSVSLTSSINVSHPIPYKLAKASLNMLMECIKVQHPGLSVYTIHPGSLNTAFACAGASEVDVGCKKIVEYIMDEPIDGLVDTLNNKLIKW